MARPVLKMIPISVLFGIFLYLGIVSLSGTQLYERIKLFFIPSKYCPNTTYARGVSCFFNRSIILLTHFLLFYYSSLGATIETQFIHPNPSLVYYDLVNDEIVQRSLLRFSARSNPTRSTSHLYLAKALLS